MNKLQKQTLYKKNCILKNTSKFYILFPIHQDNSSHISTRVTVNCFVIVSAEDCADPESVRTGWRLALHCLSLVERLMRKWWRLSLGLRCACWVVLSEDFRFAGCLPEWGSLRSRPGKTLSFRTGSGQRARDSEAGDRSAWEMTLYPASLISCSLFVQLSPSLSFQSRLPASDLALFIPSHYHALCSPSESRFLHSHTKIQRQRASYP